MAALVRRWLRPAAGNGFSPRYVLLDRSFWATDVFRSLPRARYPFLIPVAARGQKASTRGGPTGTQVFWHGCPSGWDRYRVGNAQGRTATLTVAVRRRHHAGRRGRHGRYAWA